MTNTPDMMARFALWLGRHVGLILAAIVCLIAGLLVYAGFYGCAFVVVTLCAIGLGAAWDEDTVWEDPNA